MSASEALSALQTIYAIANKVKDNKTDLLRVSGRIQHIIESLEESKNRDIIRADEYNDAITTISELITRTQRITRRMLKRSLGDRTWNASEITGDIRRLNEDVHSFLSVHTIKTLDIIHTSHTEKYTTLSNSVEEIMVKIAELDLYLRSPTGDAWAPHIQSKAYDDFAKHKQLEVREPDSILPSTSQTHAATPARRVLSKRQASPITKGIESHLLDNCGDLPVTHPIHSDPTSTFSEHRGDLSVQLQFLISSNRKSFVINDLQVMNPDIDHLVDLTPRAQVFNISMSTSLQALSAAIASAGYKVPIILCEERALHIQVTDGDSVYDATTPGGLQICTSEPLLWWWNKYMEYHDLSPTTTPLQSVIDFSTTSSQSSIDVSGVTFQFHRTLRVPEILLNYGQSLGTFPLVPVSLYSRRLSDNTAQRGGFIMPMFRREALWISFNSPTSNAVKVSVGGVNVISGLAKDDLVPPNGGAKQDYVVAGRQPWLDGIVTGPGVVRQFVVTELGEGYTVEEQVTGKAEIGGFQFDIFPRRPAVDGDFIVPGSQQHNYVDYEIYVPTITERLDPLKTPAELGFSTGSPIMFLRSNSKCQIPTSDLDAWTLSNYLRRVSPSASLKAIYPKGNPTMSKKYSISDIFFRGRGIGVSAGGRITQKLYLDYDSVRVYDEERGHRFYVHIVTPEDWEDITGVLPPITPVTRDMYLAYSIPWFKLFDDYAAGLQETSETLSQVVSVSAMDERRRLPPNNDIVDPDAPPRCSVHPLSISSSVFRPCGHVACSKCLGDALLCGSICHCNSAIKKFVGMKRPLPVVSGLEESVENDGFEGESAWVVHEMEELSTAGVQSGTVTILHLPEDKVSPLHSSIQWL